MGEAEAAAAREIILSGWVTQGPEVERFEREFAEYVGAKHACAVSNCTTALHLTLHCLGVCPGDEVITVSHSFIATANAIRHCGATPVFIDIHPRTYNMDSKLLETAITKRTKAILPVHQIGLPADMPAIMSIADRYRLPVVEDAACAIGSEICNEGSWQRIGKPHGKAACFSFHPRKVLTTGEGGMITTNDSDLDRRLRLLRQHGMSVNDQRRHVAKEVCFEQYLELGYNYRLTDIQAAIGRVQLQRLPRMLLERRQLAVRYDQALSGIRGLEPLKLSNQVRFNYQSYPVRVTDEFPVTRNELMQLLLDAGIATRRGIMNAHQEPSYIDHPGSARIAGALIQSEMARDSVLLLPMYDELTHDQQDLVIAQLQNIDSHNHQETPA